VTGLEFAAVALAGGEHARINPITELRAMIGPDAEIIGVVVPDGLPDGTR